MSKIKATADDIRKEIQRRIETSTELDGDCKDCLAPSPIRIDPNENEGCNWTVNVFPSCTPGCLDFVKNITRAVMKEYELLDV